MVFCLTPGLRDIRTQGNNPSAELRVHSIDQYRYPRPNTMALPPSRLPAVQPRLDIGSSSHHNHTHVFTSPMRAPT